MKKFHFKIHFNFLALVLLFGFSSFFYASDFTSERTYELKMSEGKSYELHELIYQEPKLIKDGAQIKSAVIKSFDTEHVDSRDLISYVNMTSLERMFGYFSLLPGRTHRAPYDHYIPTSARLYSLYDKYGGTYGYCKYSDEFKSYYHTVFSNKIARKLLFKFALNLLVEKCKIWPKDFKPAVLSILDELLVSIPKIARLSKTEFNEQIFYNSKYNYLHGFIYRRIKTDNVPLNEVLEFLKIAKNTVSELDIEATTDFKVGIHLNDDLVIYVGVDQQYYLYSKLNSKLVKVNKGYRIKEAKFLSGDDGRFYHIKYLIAKKEKTHLYDAKLNLIY